MQPHTPIRVIYHFAPLPDSNGQLVTPPPVTLTTEASELSLAWRWVRRRLGLHARGPLVPGCVFLDDVLPLPDPEAPGALMPSPAGATLLRRKAALAATPAIEQNVTPKAAATQRAAEAQAAVAAQPNIEPLPDLEIPTAGTKPPEEPPTL
jgi:hypothetical protein